MSTVQRAVALGTAVTLTAGITILGASAAHAEESILPGIDLPVPATDITDTDTNLGSVAREVVVVVDGPDGQPEVRKLKARTQAEADQLVRELNAQPGVVAEANQARRLDPVAPDADSTQLTSKAGVEQSSKRLQSAPSLAGEAYGTFQWGLPAVGAESAWQVTRGTGVVVAVIDSGVDSSHPDLSGQLLPQMDAIDDGLTGDVDGHGTHVTGIVTAAIDGAGVAGLANSVKVLPIRVMDEYGYIDDYAIAYGFYGAVEAGAKVINISIGGGYSAIEEEYVRYAINRGVTVVASGGNGGQEGSPVTYPAAYDGVIGVGAFTPSLERADFSSTGDWIDISAPGEDILSTVPGGGWESWPGTSMAAPFVAATAALVRAANPTLTKAQVDAVLLSTARDDADGDGRDTWFGAGYLQADKATMKAAQAPGGIRAIAAAAAPTASVKVKATSGKSKLFVDVNPNKGRGFWTFQVQKQNSDGTWKPLKTYKTKGSKETRTINLPKGTYQVVVNAKYGYTGSTSAPVYLKR